MLGMRQGVIGFGAGNRGHVGAPTSEALQGGVTRTAATSVRTSTAHSSTPTATSALDELRYDHRRGGDSPQAALGQDLAQEA